MTETSTKLSLPYLQAAQAQKHLTHNAALELLDLIVQLAVQSFSAATPPLAPDEGQIWAIGTGATGDWAGHDNELAAWANDGWLFIVPRSGWRGSLGTEHRVFDGAAWVAPDLPDLQNLPGVGVNASYDATNKLVVASEAVLLTNLGDDIQLKVNKAAAGDTASLLFQTDFSGRAEMGTMGEDDFAVKVSPDGSAWTTAISVAAGTNITTLANLTVTSALTLPAASVTRANLADAAALSVIGRPANSTGVPVDIAAASDHQVLRRSGTSIGFGAVNLAQSAAVTGLLSPANGGTGVANNAAATLTRSGNHALTLTTTATSSLTLPAAGTLATLAGAETLTNKTLTSPVINTAVTGTAVTQSAADTTPGRLLKVGDFGFGATTPGVITDMDNAANGSIQTNVTGTNAPGGAATAWTVMTLGYSTSAGVQYAYRLLSGAVYRRLKASGVWGPWYQVLDQQTLIGTVSQSGGVPTGAVIEKGSGANGYYRRFACGLQECWHTITLSAGAGTAWTFPAVFHEAPAVTGTAIATVLSSVQADAAASSTAVTLSALDTASARRADVAYVRATGRWSPLT